MVKFTREALLKRPFADVRHYPYGFSRSGDFSISESQALAQYGALYQALSTHQLLADTPEDQHFLDVLSAKELPNCVAEKAWLKYQARIGRPRCASIYGSKKVSASSDDAANDDNLDDALILDEA